MYLEFRQGKPQGTFLLKEMLARIGDSETRIFRIAEAPFFSFSCVGGGRDDAMGCFRDSFPQNYAGYLFFSIPNTPFHPHRHEETSFF